MADAKTHEFVVAGTHLKLTREHVIKVLKEIEPGVIDTHAVEINGKLYPVKQAFAAVSGIDSLDFNTSQARTNFKKMGFKVARSKE